LIHFLPARTTGDKKGRQPVRAAGLVRSFGRLGGRAAGSGRSGLPYSRTLTRSAGTTTASSPRRWVGSRARSNRAAPRRTRRGATTSYAPTHHFDVDGLVRGVRSPHTAGQLSRRTAPV